MCFHLPFFFVFVFSCSCLCYVLSLLLRSNFQNLAEAFSKRNRHKKTYEPTKHKKRWPWPWPWSWPWPCVVNFSRNAWKRFWKLLRKHGHGHDHDHGYANSHDQFSKNILSIFSKSYSWFNIMTHGHKQHHTNGHDHDMTMAMRFFSNMFETSLKNHWQEKALTVVMTMAMPIAMAMATPLSWSWASVCLCCVQFSNDLENRNMFGNKKNPWPMVRELLFRYFASYYSLRSA